MAVNRNSDSQALESSGRYAAQIRALIGEDHVVQARALLVEALEQHPEDSEILKLHEVLSPPRGRPRPVVDTDRSEEYAWIAANRDSYRGRWVAVDGGQLVAEAPTFAELQRCLKSLSIVPLVHRIQ